MPRAGHRQRLLGPSCFLRPPARRPASTATGPRPAEAPGPVSPASIVQRMAARRLARRASCGRATAAMTNVLSCDSPERQGEVSLRVTAASLSLDAVSRRAGRGRRTGSSAASENPVPAPRGSVAATIRLCSASSSRVELVNAAVRADRRPCSPARGRSRPRTRRADEASSGDRSEEVVTPGDRAFERPLARRRVARSAARQRQTGRQPVADDRWRQGRHAGRREFDAERQVVKQVADLGDHGRSSPGAQPGLTARARSTNSRVAAGRSGSPASAAPMSIVSGRTGIFLLAADVERGAARDDET